MKAAAAAFVPMAPLLFRHLAGAADPVADLRAAAVDAVRQACRGADLVLVLCPVGGREAPGDWHDPTRSGAERGEPQALSTQVGAHLLELAGVTAPAQFLECVAGAADDFRRREATSAAVDDGTRAPRAAGVALVVLGDGAAARSQGAPGHVDERSFAFDDAIAEALATGDGAALTAYDDEVAAALLVTGRHTWPVAATMLPQAARAELRHRSDPFGLTYFVATWHA